MTKDQDSGAPLLHRQRLVWKAGLVCPRQSSHSASTIEAVAALTLASSDIGKSGALPDGGRLHLLKHVRMDSIPPVLLAAAVFRLYINALTPDSQHFVNGMVELLLAQAGDKMEDLASTAFLARVETRVVTDLSSSPAAPSDPFAESPEDNNARIPPLTRLRNDPYALVYLAGDSASQRHLVLHLLESPQYLQPLASVPIHSSNQDSSEEQQHEPSSPLSTCLEAEYRFIDLLTSQRNERMRIQRTQSTESMLKASTANFLTRQGAASNTAAGAPSRRISKKMTLSDIEHLALSQSTKPPASSALAKTANPP
ncbi:hypothetical protein GGI21_005676, partial [Coemansia aciculifera]